MQNNIVNFQNLQNAFNATYQLHGGNLAEAVQVLKQQLGLDPNFSDNLLRKLYMILTEINIRNNKSDKAQTLAIEMLDEMNKVFQEEFSYVEEINFNDLQDASNAVYSIYGRNFYDAIEPFMDKLGLDESHLLNRGDFNTWQYLECLYNLLAGINLHNKKCTEITQVASAILDLINANQNLEDEEITQNDILQSIEVFHNAGEAEDRLDMIKTFLGIDLQDQQFDEILINAWNDFPNNNQAQGNQGFVALINNQQQQNNNIQI